jgi:circadian clock protein KaiC
MTGRESELCGTGVPGLDHILGGGLPRGCLYLIDGNPGVGKTTLALQFLLEGVRRQERCLYVTLSETKSELKKVADSHGWDLSGMQIMELSTIERAIEKGSNSIFQSSELELNELSKLLLEEVTRLQPHRVVLDSLSEMRLLAQSPLRYRRQILTFKQRLAERHCTVLLLDDRSAAGTDVQVQSIVHGVISLHMVPVKYGVTRRHLGVTKLRGVQYDEGNHDYAIKRGGLRVYARLVAADHQTRFQPFTMSSGNAEIDALLGGGLHGGTSNLLMGPAGSGKSTVATLFAHAAATRGERVNIYTFDESAHIFRDRARQIGMELDSHIASGRISLRQLDPAQVSPGELAHEIRHAVEEEKVQLIVLDSLNGYMSAMPSDEYLDLHLHELLSYLNQRGVVSIMILAQHGLVSPAGVSVDVSYLADTVVLMRYFEALGTVRKAISVIKKRSGAHETTIRELQMTATGVRIGQPLGDFQGILAGTPTFTGARDQMLTGAK